MDSEVGKLFIGGISWETTEERLKDYFSNYGEVTETVIMKDRTTGRARGFGFVVFADPSVADRVLLEKHTLDGRTVEAKKAVPRNEQQGIGGSGSLASDFIRTKKIFVGGLASTVSEEDFKKYFEQFGRITDVVVMYDQVSQRSRGFGFITFDSEDAVDRVLQKSFHELKEKLVEVKRAIPKELQLPASARGPGVPFGGGAPRGSPLGSGYGGYSSHAGGYGGRSIPGPDLRGGYPNYGGSLYGAAGYAGGGGYAANRDGGYGGAIGRGSGAGYGGGSSGTVPGGSYGAGATGYSTLPSAVSGVYGSASARNTWGTGAYGSLGSSAGHGGYGSSGGWSSRSGGAGQSAGSIGGYGRADYGFRGSHNSSTGSYGGRDSGYGGYSAQTVRMGSGSYGAGSYGDGYAASGYPDSAWRSSTSSEPFHTAAGAGAVTGYGGALSASDISSAGYGESGWPSRASDFRVKPYPATADHTGY